MFSMAARQRGSTLLANHPYSLEHLAQSSSGNRSNRRKRLRFLLISIVVGAFETYKNTPTFKFAQLDIQPRSSQ
jgi:hypothetical protein